LQFSLGNCICGQLVKKGLYNNDSIPEIRYTNDSLWIEDKHEEIVALDTPIGNFITKEEFENRKEKPIEQSKIEEIDKLIKNLEDFYSNQTCFNLLAVHT
jgi:hypothetical protein